MKATNLTRFPYHFFLKVILNVQMGLFIQEWKENRSFDEELLVRFQI